ncbi:LOW QUALITY PROTEIN: MIT domain-containing protein 1-like [Rhipicephalus sanguineus]|uniref:LOW QUALITY PROTEIN: MIT domain-containing protein 1-like n=1 Tax=Rhipicephalus sanguineus TaxID=34632 RepID=UPI001893E2A3|nr:LOW QUALITY PROTEIN: MIT domain-containing protein 1-like [Rhipicephalus sanguineus]
MAAPKRGGLEKAAASVLTRAVEHDQAARYTSALVCYQEGIQLLIDALKETTDTIKRDHLRNRVKTYMDRAEKIKEQVRKEKAAGTYHEQIHIESGSVGHSYDQTFGHLLDDMVTSVEVDDPYVRSVHQVQNFVRLCELLKKKCPCLRSIKLTTGLDQRDQQSQLDRLLQVKTSLADNGIVMAIEYSETLHDREIRLDTGWIIKIGRGLDYFRPAATKFSLGYFDHDLRTCHETTIDIFHRNYVHTS